MQFLVFCTAVHPRGEQVAGAAAREHRQRRQRSPPRRERSAAGDPLDLPRRHAHRHLRADREGRREVDQARRRCSTPASWCCPSCRATPATATARARSPSPATSSSSARCRRTRASRYPNIALNVAVTESLDYMATELEKAVKGGKTLEQAVGELLPKVIKENKRIIFNGNNYSTEWEKEAGQARPAQPEEHRRRAAAARHEGRHRDCSRSTRSSTSASCTRATRSWSRPTTRPSTSRAS